MPRSRADHPVTIFFRQRLIHFRSQYEQTPGLIAADWRDPKLSWRQILLRGLLYKFRQGTPSPPGLSKLPFELLDMIFRELCGREVHAVRLVCADWEAASRPFFADLRLRRSLFWLTASGLRRLERLAHKFGPYMGDMYIATDYFNVAGLWRVVMNYREHARYSKDVSDPMAKHEILRSQRRAFSRRSADGQTMPLLGHVHQPLSGVDEPRNQYFRHAYQQRQPVSPWRFLRLWPFVWLFICGIVTQAWMRLTRQDRRALGRIVKLTPNGRLVAVDMSYAAEVLNFNEQKHGRASPGFAAELALLCGRGEVLPEAGYRKHVKDIVGIAMRDAHLQNSMR